MLLQNECVLHNLLHNISLLCYYYAIILIVVRVFIEVKMPNKCCVPNCRGNYKDGPKLSVFSFPNDAELRKKWLRAICRDDFVPTKYTKVDNKKAFKCGEAGGSQNVNSAFCTGNFSGRLDVWDIQNTTFPVFSCTEHGDIISAIDTVGGGIPGCGSPEILTCSKDGLVKVWDTRVKSSVATIGPDSGEARRECWTACFGNAYNSEQRVIAAGYDNGDIKIYDLRIMSIKYETHCSNGVCCVEFDRKDIPINKIVATTLESGILIYDVSRQTKKGYPCRKEKARAGTVWLVRHLPQNREVFVTCGGSGEVTLWQYHYPEQRYKTDANGDECTVVGSIEEVQNADIASQPIISYDWNASRQGLAVCTALDQTVRVLIVTKLNEL